MQKDLLTITIRSRVPIEFSSAYIIPMNLDSFVGVSTKENFFILWLYLDT